ncbi:hypothetical protein HYH02_013060 [Chlamydomonas schloesseri]|uniref:ABC transporter domain-containing protein n=1 Tax=Chlamydomonas schloesseri TaxID=2026947 RepID=A0A835VWX0_9CHLO|nr:hypothetical protein HYH02_013060 [Chlamydomonas schloesseri]|eukprot:KAG2432342.1 hypothetical protein HYH02_013060 [Chlamydomonas schloesseri]
MQVGERGLKLSGGEKQRVAIARAFLRSPRLLICDEATSALDSATEAAIMESLKELAQGRSTLFVAHRLSTVRGCDRIVVLRGGRVVEEGSHDQLMERGGEYAAMWNLQADQHDDEDAGADGMGGGGGGGGSNSHVDDGGVTDTEAEIELALEAQHTQQAAAAAAAAANGSSKRPVSVAAAAGAVVGGKGGPAGLSLDSMDEVATYSRRAAAAVVAAAASATAAAAAVGGGVNAA